MKGPVRFIAFLFLIGCSSAPDAPKSPDTVEQDTNPTTPPPAVAEAPAEEGPRAPAPLAVSPGCGLPGTRAVLRLGLTREGNPPSCYRVEDFTVLFAPALPARITLVGPTSDGYCAVDVIVPEGAESGAVSATVGRELFESTMAFHLPCAGEGEL